MEQAEQSRLDIVAEMSMVEPLMVAFGEKVIPELDLNEAFQVAFTEASIKRVLKSRAKRIVDTLVPGNSIRPQVINEMDELFSRMYVESKLISGGLLYEQICSIPRDLLDVSKAEYWVNYLIGDCRFQLAMTLPRVSEGEIGLMFLLGKALSTGGVHFGRSVSRGYGLSVCSRISLTYHQAGKKLGWQICKEDDSQKLCVVGDTSLVDSYIDNFLKKMVSGRA